jgi:hypothetical protein
MVDAGIDCLDRSQGISLAGALQTCPSNRMRNGHHFQRYDVTRRQSAVALRIIVILLTPVPIMQRTHPADDERIRLA